jgi:1-acyl-sn-glycerol-3-phosphate acyltransferase
MAILKPQHVPFYVFFFRIYTRLMIRWHFKKVNLHGEFTDLGYPVLMIGNHFSWWDGFIANLLNLKVLHRRIHIMMLEEQLSGRGFLRKTGAYSVKRGSRSVLESLDFTADLLNNEKNLVVFYPQGEFESIYKQDVRFEKGIRRINSRARNKFHFVFYVALVDYFSFRKPSLSIYFREFPQELALNPEALEMEYNVYLRECIKQQRPG